MPPTNQNPQQPPDNHVNDEPEIVGQIGEVAHAVGQGLGPVVIASHFLNQHLPAPVHALGEITEVASEVAHDITHHHQSRIVESAVCGTVSGLVRVAGTAILTARVVAPAAVVNTVVETPFVGIPVTVCIGIGIQAGIDRTVTPWVQATNRICHDAFSWTRGEESLQTPSQIPPSANTQLSTYNARREHEAAAVSDSFQETIDGNIDSFGLSYSPEFATNRPISSSSALGFFRGSTLALNESSQAQPFTSSQNYSLSSNPDIGSSLRDASLRGRTRSSSSTALIVQRLNGTGATSSQVSLPNGQSTPYRSRERIIHDNNNALNGLVSLQERTEQRLPQREHSEFRLPVRDYSSHFINEAQKNSFVFGEFSIFLSECPRSSSMNETKMGEQGSERSGHYSSHGGGHDNCVTTDGGVCVTTSDGGHVTTGYGCW